jgi:hypothetical protein
MRWRWRGSQRQDSSSPDLLGERHRRAQRPDQRQLQLCLDASAEDWTCICMKLTQLGKRGSTTGWLAALPTGNWPPASAGQDTSDSDGGEHLTYHTCCCQPRRSTGTGAGLQAALRAPADWSRCCLGGTCARAYDEPAEWRGATRPPPSRQLLAELMACGLRPAVAPHLGWWPGPGAGPRGGSRSSSDALRRPLAQAELVAAGFPSPCLPRVAWYPYLTRRLAERPSNVWFFARAFFGH